LECGGLTPLFLVRTVSAVLEITDDYKAASGRSTPK